MDKKIYVSKNSDYDGYNQAFSQIMEGGKGVQRWARDGSLKDGDVVYECIPIYRFSNGRLHKIQQDKEKRK